MKRIWVVDDKIPVDHLYTGPQPTRLEPHFIRELANHADKWEEQPVLDLCRAVSGGEYEASFFTSPDAMLAAMKEGIRPPHVVIFDWEYLAASEDKKLAALRRVLTDSFAFVQIYTHFDAADIDARVADLRERYAPRLLPTCSKDGVKTDQLTKQVRDAWEGTIAGDVADAVRAAVGAAVEHCLIDMSSVPRGVLAAVTGANSANVVQLVLSRVRDDIGASETELFKEIIAAGTNTPSSAALRKLMSVWYYSFPADKKIRRGDVIEIDDALGLVVTPPCHLYRFPKKTGRRLTWVELVPFTQDSVADLKRGGLKFNNVGTSIVADQGDTGEAMILLPNMPTRAGSREDLQDFALLCHAWHSDACTEAEAPTGKELSYAQLQRANRRCTLADPFLSAVITRLTTVMSAPGTPDLPESERVRLNSAFVAPGAAAPARGAARTLTPVAPPPPPAAAAPAAPAAAPPPLPVPPPASALDTSLTPTPADPATAAAGGVTAAGAAEVDAMVETVAQQPSPTDAIPSPAVEEKDPSA